MAEKEPLPELLQYLQPFREFLAKLPKAEVGELTDTTLLEELLRERVRGMTEKEAEDKLNADAGALENYLAEPSRRNDRLHFVTGFLMIAVGKPDFFLKPPEKPEVIEERLTMELPPKAKATVDEWSLGVKWMKQRFYAQRCKVEDKLVHKQTLERLANPNATAYEHYLAINEPTLAEMIPVQARQIRKETIDVRLGEVTGHKCIQTGDMPAVWKRVDYLLKIPGGYVSVTISGRLLFDEGEWDPFLRTLRFTKSGEVKGA